MAANKYVARVLGKWKEVFGQQTSVGVPDANKIVALDGTGKLDVSLFPAGIGPEVKNCLAFENLTAGNFVNLFLSGGVIQARKADATDATKPAHGFVLDTTTATNSVNVYLLS
jgi:hypothetical protein